MTNNNRNLALRTNHLKPGVQKIALINKLFNQTPKNKPNQFKNRKNKLGGTEVNKILTQSILSNKNNQEILHGEIKLKRTATQIMNKMNNKKIVVEKINEAKTHINEGTTIRETTMGTRIDIKVITKIIEEVTTTETETTHKDNEQMRLIINLSITIEIRTIKTTTKVKKEVIIIEIKIDKDITEILNETETTQRIQMSRDKTIINETTKIDETIKMIIDKKDPEIAIGEKMITNKKVIKKTIANGQRATKLASIMINRKMRKKNPGLKRNQTQSNRVISHPGESLSLLKMRLNKKSKQIRHGESKKRFQHRINESKSKLSSKSSPKKKLTRLGVAKSIPKKNPPGPIIRRSKKINKN